MHINETRIKLTEIGPLASQDVHYQYIDVYRVQGLSTIPGGGDAGISITRPGVQAVLVSDPNAALAPIDIRQGLGTFILRGLFGGDTTDAEFDRLCAGLHSERGKQFQVPAVYLVVKIEGITQLRACERSWRFRNMRVVIDAVDKQSIRAHCRPVVASIAAATAFVAWDESPYIDRVADGIALRRQDGEELSSVTFSMSGAELSIARPLTGDDIIAISEVASCLCNDRRLETPLRLLADASLKRQDKLEAFLLAWASLEVLGKKFTAGVERGDWRHAVGAQRRAYADQLHEKFIKLNAREYGSVDRIRALLTMHGFDAEPLSNAINEIRKNHREPLYHAGALNETALPVREVTNFIKRLLDVVTGRDEAPAEPGGQ